MKKKKQHGSKQYRKRPKDKIQRLIENSPKYFEN